MRYQAIKTNHRNRLAIASVICLTLTVAMITISHGARLNDTKDEKKPDDKAKIKIRLSASLLWGGKKILLVAENPTKEDVTITEPGCKGSRLVITHPSGKRVPHERWKGPTSTRLLKAGMSLAWQYGFLFDRQVFPGSGTFKLSWEMGDVRSAEHLMYMSPAGVEVASVLSTDEKNTDNKTKAKIRLSASQLWGGKEVLLAVENPTTEDVTVTVPGCKGSRLVITHPSGKRVPDERQKGPASTRLLKAGTRLAWRYLFDGDMFPAPGIYKLSWQMGDTPSAELLMSILPKAKGEVAVRIHGMDVKDVFDIDKLYPGRRRSQEMMDIIKKYPQEQAIDKLRKLRDEWAREDKAKELAPKPSATKPRDGSK